MARDKTASNRPDGVLLAATPRQQEVLRIIRGHQNIARAEIGALLQASASQVSRLTAPLIARKIVTVDQRLPHVEGRPTELLALAGDTHYVVGIDVGGLAQEAVVTNLRGDVMGAAYRTGSPARSRSSIIDGLVDLTDRAIEESGIPRDQVLGVGVGVRAIIDPVSGVVSAGPETPAWSSVWADFDVRGQLARALPWKRLVIDDTVRAVAAAERQYGAAAGIDDFVYLLADSGIGAALMIEGRPYIGPAHLAGEVGHISLDRNGPICGCGRHGCVEMYASTSAMLRRGREIDPSIATMRDLIERDLRGDEPFRQILAEGGDALGRAIAILLNLLSPALIVVGGRATESSTYLTAAQSSARQNSLDLPFRNARIVTSEPREHIAALGAATLMLNQLFGTAPLPARAGRASSLSSIGLAESLEGEPS